MSLTPRPRSILIMAGGTGGHVFPALSIARELQAAGVEVSWLGTRAGLEARVIPEAGIAIHYVNVGGLRGKRLWKKLLAPFMISLAVLQSLRVLLRVRPGCVLGMGGFVTGPGGLAAWLLRRPLLLHEQNAIAGFTNLLLLPFADRVLEAFPGAFVRKRDLARNRLVERLVVASRPQTVGNPVRPSIAALPPPEVRFAGREGPLRLLVLGGSLGAAAINQALPALLAELQGELPEGQRPLIWHQTGARNLEETLTHYANAGVVTGVGGPVKVAAFIDDMAQAYGWADLVLCRAGALTVAELAAAGLGAILVPYQHAVDDHQVANGQVLVDAGAAWMLRQYDFSVALLRQILEPHLHDRGPLLERALRARALALPGATRRVADECLEALDG